MSIDKLLERRKLKPKGQIVLTYNGGDIGAFYYCIKPACRIILQKPGWPLIKIGNNTFTQEEALKLTAKQIRQYYETKNVFYNLSSWIK